MQKHFLAATRPVKYGFTYLYLAQKVPHRRGFIKYGILFYRYHKQIGHTK